VGIGTYAFLWLSGMLVGAAVAAPGWQKWGAAGSLGSVGFGQFVGAGKPGEQQTALAAFLDLSRHGPFNAFGFGVAAGIMVFQGLGALAIISAARLSADEADDPAPLTVGTERARTFFSEGLVAYNSLRRVQEIEERKRRDERRQAQWEQALKFEELLTAALVAAVKSPPRDVDQAWRECGAMAAMLLRNVFEETPGQHRDFRFEMFEVVGNMLVPRAWAGCPDAPHDRTPLPMKSFLGDVVRTREPDVWVKGAKGNKTKRPYHKRTDESAELKYACFLAHPLPCDTAPAWGGFTIDYVRPSKKVFSEARRFAIRAFARYTEVLYSLASQEARHEEQAAAR
jgi:hypothetical protein